MLGLLALVFLWSGSWAIPKGTLSSVTECQYEGQRVVLLADRLQVDGRDVLVLNKVNHTWTVFVAEGDQEPALTSLDTLQKLEGCEELMKMLSYTETSAGISVFGVVVSVLAALFFIGFVLLSFKFAEFGAVGGVLGSIVHYPGHLRVRGIKDSLMFLQKQTLPNNS
ncbi:uncharacterized protein [Salminus brasiliensis]|uniref:uncharacterized protein n=1 Tax=Salminus brasiliensis TaxID=930266 RepID=UPI003B830445